MMTLHTISYFALVLLRQSSVEYEIWTPPEDIHLLCPDTSFCSENDTETFPLSGDNNPCCLPCSCSEHCGLYDNCCHWTLDKYRTQEKFKMICRSQEAIQGQNRQFGYYKMMNKCLGKSNELDNVISCEQNTSNPLLTFYPVYSPSFGMTYINPDCAKCNTVTDGIKWQKVVTCANKIDDTYFEDVENLIQGKNTEIQDGCILYYIPPEGFDLTTAKCEPNVIRTCNTTKLVKRKDESWDRCSEFNATFIYTDKKETMVYGNVYCWMCNTNRRKPRACWEKNYPINVYMSLVVILDMTYKDEQDSQQMTKLCRPSEVFLRSSKRSCRPRRCPFGQILFEEKCGFYSKEWRYVDQFSVLFKLIPTTIDTIPVSFFGSMPTIILTNRYAEWLQRGTLQDWFVLPAIQTTDNRTSVIQLIIKLTYPNNSADPSYLQRSIKQALRETWFLKHGAEKFPLNVTLNDVKNYTLKNIVYDLSELQMKAEAEAFVASHVLYQVQIGNQSVYEQDLLFPLYPFQFLEEFSYGFFLTKLFLCQQVDLFLDEFHFSFGKILFQVTNKTIYDADFRNVLLEQDVGTATEQKWTVRVCIDEFPDGLNSSHGRFSFTKLNVILTSVLCSVWRVI